MNTAAKVDQLIAEWKASGISNADLTVRIAEACMGWPYIYGDRGTYCTAAHRKAVHNSHPDQTGLIDKCRILKSGASGCTGCTFYPGGRTRAFDCRGFTYWCLLQAGIKIMGAGATSQWNDNSNWEAKGQISDMPNRVCCVFKYKDGKMQHTGLHIGGGQIIHCSNGVQRGKTTDRGWTHYAVPKGIGGDTPMPIGKPTLRRGDQGEYVTLAQTQLIQKGYSLDPYGADGKFGKVTEKAVKQLQTDEHLKVDGVIGQDTWDALDNLSPVKPLYTVSIPHLTMTEADALVQQFSGASMIEERW